MKARFWIHQDDFCHFCEGGKSKILVDISSPAETRCGSSYHRICESCIDSLEAALYVHRRNMHDAKARSVRDTLSLARSLDGLGTQSSEEKK
jgi:hypothetical protein